MADEHNSAFILVESLNIVINRYMSCPWKFVHWPQVFKRYGSCALIHPFSVMGFIDVTHNKCILSVVPAVIYVIAIMMHNWIQTRRYMDNVKINYQSIVSAWASIFLGLHLWQVDCHPTTVVSMWWYRTGRHISTVMRTEVLPLRSYGFGVLILAWVVHSYAVEMYVGRQYKDEIRKVRTFVRLLVKTIFVGNAFLFTKAECYQDPTCISQGTFGIVLFVALVDHLALFIFNPVNMCISMCFDQDQKNMGSGQNNRVETKNPGSNYGQSILKTMHRLVCWTVASGFTVSNFFAFGSKLGETCFLYS